MQTGNWKFVNFYTEHALFILEIRIKIIQTDNLICQFFHAERSEYPNWKLKLSALSIDYAPGFYVVALGQSLWKKEGEKYMFVSLGRGGIRLYQYIQWANILLEKHQQQKFRKNAKKKEKKKQKEKERVKMNEAFCNSSYMGQPTFYTVTQTSWLKEVDCHLDHPFLNQPHICIIYIVVQCTPGSICICSWLKTPCEVWTLLTELEKYGLKRQ